MLTLKGAHPPGGPPPPPHSAAPARAAPPPPPPAGARGGAARGGGGPAPLLTVADPVMEPAILCEPLLSGGSLVLVARAEPERLEATYVAEHATARFPA